MNASWAGAERLESCVRRAWWPVLDEDGSLGRPTRITGFGSLRTSARDFTVDGPNKVWMGDITYIATFAGRMYLAVILDLFSRKVIGWALAGHMRDELVLEALDNAIRNRGSVRGVLHHSDRGSQLRLKESSQHGLVARRIGIRRKLLRHAQD